MIVSKADQKQAVNRRSTDELLSLVQATDKLDRVVLEHAADFSALSFPAMLAQLTERKRLTPAQLGEKALLSRSFTYQLFSGDRAPSRDMILRLSVVLELNVEETQAFLRSAQRGALYPRVPRDAAIINALSRHLDVAETEDLLSTLGETSLL